MAMYHYNLNTFKDVEWHYDHIVPIRGSDNIRPLGDRARKWEHIMKVSRNKYVLCDTLPEEGSSRPIWAESRVGLIKRAAVTWTRDPSTGIERIRIRNGSGDYAHNSRYRFLERALPRCFDFIINSGKQFVRAYSDGDRQYLPKSKWVSEELCDHYETMRSRYRTHGMTRRDDKKYLEYERDPNTHKWLLIHGNHKRPVTRYRIDKKAKSNYRQACKAFVEWAWTMKPLLVDDLANDWETRQRIQLGYGTAFSTPEEFRKVLADENDGRRTPAVSYIMNQMAEWDWKNSRNNLTDDPHIFRRQFLNQVNQYAGFKQAHYEFKEG